MKKKLIAAVLVVGSMFTLVGCGSNIEPESTLDSYVYSQVQLNHEIKIPIENIFMVNTGKYLAKADIGSKNGITPAYDMEIYTSFEFGQNSSLGYVSVDPAINYIEGNESYVVITDAGRRVTGKGLDHVHAMNVKIYVSRGNLNSAPNNKGKAGTDPNVKIN